MPQYSLSYSAIKLAKHVCTYTGEKEINEKGQEVLSSRRLNGEESAQRSHLRRNTEEFEKQVEKEMNDALQVHNEMVSAKKKSVETENPMSPEETPAVYAMRINELLMNDSEWQAKAKESQKQVEETVKELLFKKGEVELTEKTLGVMKKYFDLFSEQHGFVREDDRAVEELVALFA